MSFRLDVLGLAVVAAVLSTSECAHAGEGSASAASINYARLGGISLGEPFGPVSARLGTPLRTVHDAGAAFGTQYFYRGIVLWAGLGVDNQVVVTQIESTSPKYCTETGVCPGMSIEDVQRILGRPIYSDAVVDGRNSFLIDDEGCWLDVRIAKRLVALLAIRCQP